MSGIGPSIGRHQYGSGGPTDPLYLASIQKDKGGPEGEETIGNPKSKIFALVAATLYLKKFVDQFLTIARSLTVSINAEKALADLAEFKKILEVLKTEDKSHVPDYTQQLSLSWQKVAENCTGLEERVGHLDPLSAQIMNFIKEIHNFPPGEDHTLGYYLTEHAGQEWIPFPFMNMLRDLHEECLASPETSQLMAWIRKIDEILTGFG